MRFRQSATLKTRENVVIIYHHHYLPHVHPHSHDPRHLRRHVIVIVENRYIVR